MAILTTARLLEDAREQSNIYAIPKEIETWDVQEIDIKISFTYSEHWSGPSVWVTRRTVIKQFPGSEEHVPTKTEAIRKQTIPTERLPHVDDRGCGVVSATDPHGR
jgi:hypothetical protein